MVMETDRIKPPPPPSTPKEAPWIEAETALEKFDLLNANIGALISAIKALSLVAAPGALGAPPAVSLLPSRPGISANLTSNIEDAGTATGGSNTTLTDSSKYWSTNVWGRGAIILMSIGGTLYTSTILLNSDQTITFLPLPTGVKPALGTPYAIKSLYAAFFFALTTKAARKIVDLANLAALGISTLADCTAIDLYVGGSALAITLECTFNAAAVLGAKVHVRTSYDGSNYDTQDFDTWSPTFVAGASIRATKSYDVSPKYMKVLIENLDAAQQITSIAVWSTVRG